MTEEEMITESDRLTQVVADIAAEWKTSDKTDDLLYMRYTQAQLALIDWRRYWRHIGAAVDDSHPGSRPSNVLAIGIQVRNNVEV